MELEQNYYFQNGHGNAVGWQMCIPAQQFWQYEHRITATRTVIIFVYVKLHCKCAALDAVHNALILRSYCDNRSLPGVRQNFTLHHLQSWQC